MRTAEALRKCREVGRAFPVLAYREETADAPTVVFPVLVALVATRPPVGQLTYRLGVSYAAGDDKGPSLRLALLFSAPGTPEVWRVDAWFDPASELDDNWLNQLLRTGRAGIEFVSVAEAHAQDWTSGARECLTIEATADIQRTLERNWARGMARAGELPWASLDFETARLAHAARHPLVDAFAR